MNSIQSGLVDPARLSILLEEAGWRLVGGRPNVYSRFAPPDESVDGRTRSLVVPLDMSAPDFEDSMSAALAELSGAEYRDSWLREISPRLGSAPSDQFKFRKESGAPIGLIAWRQGEQLIRSAQSALLAGAKTWQKRARYFGSREGRFAGRYLDSILMGQTAVGSYVVTAYAPTDTSVAVRGDAVNALGYENIDYVFSREVTVAVVRAMQATAEAVQHYHSTGSYSGFDAGVASGVSSEMATALSGIASDSDGADIAIEWDRAVPLSDSSLDSYFELQASDAPVLVAASEQLAEGDPARSVTVTGRVEVLTKKQAGGPGVIAIEIFGSESPRRVRVRVVSPDDHHQMVRAYDEDLAVQVSGEIRREGNYYWLDDARLISILGSIEELASRFDVNPSQEQLFDDDSEDFET
ncbi:hypothetical protein ABIA35_009578 [Catenulispora sp. MAP12-49]|uniref:hypothetical protein n=1 Tax=Catenulispora sp. MAP12-49 TaxID=3156302 RepID=UPI003514F8BB